MSAHRLSAATGRLRRSVEQQGLWHSFVDKLVEPKIGEEAAPAARRDESGLITLFGTAAASRREPTGELGAAAPDRAASEARAAADDQPTWQLQGANVADLAGYRPSRSKKKVRLKRHRTLSLIRPFFIHLD